MLVVNTKFNAVPGTSERGEARGVKHPCCLFKGGERGGLSALLVEMLLTQAFCRKSKRFI